MELGLLPSLGGGIGDLRRSGQDSRLVDGYFRAYARAFDRVRYFSYLVESLHDYTDDPDLARAVDVVAPARSGSRFVRALTLPFVHAPALRRCSVLRVFQVTGAIPALIARARWGIPFVTTYGFWHSGLSGSGRSRIAKRMLERVAFRRAASVIVTTEDLRAHVAAVIPAERIVMIPNGVDTVRFAPEPRAASATRRILYVGRLSREKNLETLLAAAGKLAGRWPLEVTFVGSGPLDADLRRQAEALGIDLVLAGVVDHRHLPSWYRRADVFVLASFTEGHPKALIEAMASGPPCVVSDCSGNRALVTEGRTGLFFDPSDPDALAERIERLFANPDLARRLGTAARDVVIRQYDLAGLVEREIALLRRVAGAR